MTIQAAACRLCLLTLLSASAHAELSANIGWASDYYFRGVFQSASAASGGLDFGAGGFYAGTWAADVDDGLEVDGYLGYGGEVGELGYGVGFTGYYYTGDFDDTYEELNLSLGYGIASLDVALGRYDNFDAAAEDYAYYALTLEKNGAYATFAGFGRDFDGEYLELGYGFEAAALDFGLSLIVADDDATGATGEALVFSIGKTLALD